MEGYENFIQYLVPSIWVPIPSQVFTMKSLLSASN